MCGCPGRRLRRSRPDRQGFGPDRPWFFHRAGGRHLHPCGPKLPRVLALQHPHSRWAGSGGVGVSQHGRKLQLRSSGSMRHRTRTVAGDRPLPAGRRATHGRTGPDRGSTTGHGRRRCMALSRLPAAMSAEAGCRARPAAPPMGPARGGWDPTGQARPAGGPHRRDARGRARRQAGAHRTRNRCATHRSHMG